jgi:transcription initiation factor TFIIIB Brf1 subunit/transcription initiation factor TFIIB
LTVCPRCGGTKFGSEGNDIGSSEIVCLTCGFITSYVPEQAKRYESGDIQQDGSVRERTHGES